MRPSPDSHPLLSLRGISKRFASVAALTEVDLDLHAGEVHALLGENGAGKSTLMNALYGLVRIDGGTIRWRGEPVHFRTCLDARRAGIGMVHQEFSLVDALSVLENLTLGLSPPRSLAWHRRRVAAAAGELARNIGLEIGDLAATAGSLPVGVRQRVEILKALANATRILILDEPTAVLTPQESQQLFDVLQRLRDRGTGIVFITHRLSEVTAIADRVTIMRGGRVVARKRRGEATESELARSMVGDLPPRARRPPRSSSSPQPPPLRLRRLSVQGEQGAAKLVAVDLEVGAGEIVGIAGVDGNGQSQLFRVLTGLTRPSGGQIDIAGKRLTCFQPSALIDAGVGHIPPHRLREGVVPAMSVQDNAVLNRAILGRLARGPFLPPRSCRRLASDLVRAYAIKAPDLDLPVSVLSGGNLQLLIVARALAARPRVLVAFNPTRGLDIRAAEAVYSALDRAVADGTAVLLISTDTDEVTSISDRIAVLSRGHLSHPLQPPFSMDHLARLMAGLPGGEG